MNDKVKVAFICVHNSCRSQIAEALGKHYVSDKFEFYSAGTILKPHINRDAVRIIKSQFNIDMADSQYSKLISDIPPVDIAVTMGCNVACPNINCKYLEDWGLEDPTGKNDDEFERVIDIIYKNIKDLCSKIESNYYKV